MGKQQWTEIEKEYELVNGQWTEKGKKMISNPGITQKTKDIWEIISKCFTAIAIFIPFFIITQQFKQDRIKETKLKRSQIYPSILTDLSIYYVKVKANVRPELDSTLRTVVDRIGAQYEANLALYSHNETYNLYDTIRNFILLTEEINKLKNNYTAIFLRNVRLSNFSNNSPPDSMCYVTYNSFLKNSSEIISNVDSINDKIQECEYLRGLIVKRITHDSVNFESYFPREYKKDSIFIDELAKFNTKLSDDLIKEKHKGIDEIQVYRIKDNIEIDSMTRIFNQHLKFIDSLFHIKYYKLELAFWSELR